MSSARSMPDLPHPSQQCPNCPILCRLLPARVSEVIGVCHLKAYVFDDNVLISGANLSTTYFTKRQDRYYLIKGAASLATFIRNLIKVLLSSCHVGNLMRHTDVIMCAESTL